MINRDKIYNYLSTKGLNKASICGIMSNIYYESNYSPTAVGDNGTSFGLCQWHLSRREDLFRYAGKRGLNVNNIETQIDFMLEELHTSYMLVDTLLRNNSNSISDAYNVADVFCKYYEVPADKINKARERGSYARLLYQQYTNEINLNKYTNKELANMVIEGKFGNGEERRQKLGNRYNSVQKIVNETLNVKNNKLTDDINELANSVIRGDYGNGEERRQKLGNLYSIVQKKVNELLGK